MGGGVHSRGDVYFKIRDFRGAFIRGRRLLEAGRLFEEIRYEPVAKCKYNDILRYKYNRNIKTREAGLVLNPSLYRLGASPDGVVCDNSYANSKVGCLEVKYPESIKNYSPSETMRDSSFYVELVDGKQVPKRNHSLEYLTQIQLKIGLACSPWCNVVVYRHKGMIIIRVPFDHDYPSADCSRHLILPSLFPMPSILVTKYKGFLCNLFLLWE